MKPTPNSFLRPAAFVASLAFANHGHATIYYWDGNGAADSNYATNTSWATTLAGGTDPAGAPTSTDDAVFSISSITTGRAANLQSSVQQINSWTFNGAGTFNFYARNSATGRLFAIGAGGITLNSGAGAVTINGAGTNGTFLTTKLNAGQTWTNNSSNSLTFSSNYAGSKIDTNGKALVIGGSGNTIVNQLVTGTGSVEFNGSGSAALTLSVANDYTGVTKVSAGTLAITGAGSINSTSGVTIGSSGTFRYNSSVAYSGGTITNNGGTITGTGDIGVAVTLDSLADKLAPGNSPGIQTYSVGQTWNSFTYQWETNNFTGNTAGTNFDQLGINGSLTLTGAAANSYALDIFSLTGSNTSGAVPNFAETSRQWTILTTTGGITGFNAAYWNILTSGFTSSPTWTGNFSVTADSNNIYLNYAAVPEPRAAMIGSIGLCALLRRRRF